MAIFEVERIEDLGLLGTVLVDFYSPDCGPCRMMVPALYQLAKEGVVVAKVNVHQNPDLMEGFRISSLPTLVVLRNGEEVGRKVGFANILQIKQLLGISPPTLLQRVFDPHEWIAALN